ncbi:MAG TPA: glycosyltransferase family 1 protein [Chloroflexota bacterium]|nr:glycosyltransferase family 1 protein [Chloroflexota bacterium]
MRIAVDARLVGYVRGGTSQYTLRLVNALAALRTGDELLVLESLKPGMDASWPASVRRVPLFTPPHHRLEQLALPVELLRLGADLLHSPDFIPPFRRGCASVITVHDLAFLRYPYLLTPESSRYYGQVARAVVSADQVIAVSHATRQDILEMLPADPEKVTVVHSAAGSQFVPLPPEEIEKKRRELGLPDRFVLFVGTLEPRKNLPVLLEAFAGIWRAHRVPLVVVGGKGWLYEEIFRARDRLGLTQEVCFAGPVPADQLLYYYNSATCLVMPSLYEGFGMPVLEAMACGIPVVVSDVSSLPEVVGDAGIRVAPENPEAWEAALVQLIGDSEMRADLGARGLRRAGGFSWEKTAVETLSVYHRAVKGHQ